MNEMALNSTKKKKKHQYLPDLLPSSLQEDVSGEQKSYFDSKEKKARLLHLFDSCLNYLETPTKSQGKVKVKAKKHTKKWKEWERAKKKNPSLLMEKENIVLCSENMNDPVYQKDKHLRESKNHSREPNCLDSNQREVGKMSDSSFLELLTKKKDKKAKRLHNSECGDGTQGVLRGTKEKHLKIFKATPKSQSTEKQFCFPLFLDPLVNGKRGQKGLSRRRTPRLQVPCKHEEFDAVHFFRGSTIKGFQQNRKLCKGILQVANITEKSSCASTESPLSSTPKTLEVKTCDSEEELDMGDREDNRPSQMSSDAEAISSDIDSQELFITQQLHNSFLPLHPPNNAKEAVSEGSCSNSNTSSSLQFSQVSAAKETFENSFLRSSCSLTPSKRREHFPATQECGVQTDDFFSSLAVASFLIKREPIDCHEQPLDLSLPYRIRSGVTDAEIFHSLEGAGDGISMSPRCKLETTVKVPDDESESLMCSQSQKSEDIKYIQMHLNSSYYFKLKGDPGATVSRTPLVKLKDPDVTVFGTPLGKLTLEKRKRKK
ncbi:uncharacterized protein [Tiliqua scincoides]|uniref:uncharacterized protein n=1 Tax=Tiliqua scincoides TaxID=71010 RepID=UPI0034620898